MSSTRMSTSGSSILAALKEAPLVKQAMNPLQVENYWMIFCKEPPSHEGWSRCLKSEHQQRMRTGQRTLLDEFLYDTDRADPGYDSCGCTPS